jgi:hypothetical protein
LYQIEKTSLRFQSLRLRRLNKRLGALTFFLVSAVAYTNFYLPQFSEESEKRRQQIQHIRESGGDVPKTQLSAGSTWLNMAKIRDSTK